ncbi:MAG: hypothetical protein AABY22_36455 [Nanoarchaeota archaeon]
MPCISESNWEREDRVQKEQQKLREELNLVTRLLCEVLGTFEFIPFLSSEVQEWWACHREFDKKRLEKEVQNKLNSLKLTDKEKEIMKDLLTNGNTSK